MRGFHIHMVDKFTQRAVQNTPSHSFDIETKNQVGNGSHQQRVHQNLKRVFVKRGNGLNPTWTVVKLMKEQPQNIAIMTQTMPPIKNKGNAQVANKPQNIIGQFIQKIPLLGLKPLVPSVHPQHNNTKLNDIHNHHPTPPSLDFGQYSVGKDTFSNNEGDADGNNDYEECHS